MHKQDYDGVKDEYIPDPVEKLEIDRFLDAFHNLTNDPYPRCDMRSLRYARAMNEIAYGRQPVKDWTLRN